MGLSISLPELGICTTLALGAVQLLTDTNPIGRSIEFLKQFQTQEGSFSKTKNVNVGNDVYADLHSAKDASRRSQEYDSLVDTYYDLVTPFFEVGWGPSFHFAYRFAFESFAESMRRHEYHLVSKLALLGSGKKLLDVGCGIGGPLRNICRFLQTHTIVGVTINHSQVDRGNYLCSKDDSLPTTENGEKKCRLVQGDFHHLPFESNSFDGAYAVEATCHAPDRVKVYSQVYQVLKPGSIFACYEWCLTDKFVKGNPEHELIKKRVEEGDGLPDICHYSVCVKALKDAGFEVVETRDMLQDTTGRHSKPWHLPLMPSWNPLMQRFQFNWLGFRLTNMALRVLEFMYIAPKGTVRTQQMLQTGAKGLTGSGETGVMTPLFLMVGRVPMDKKTNGSGK